jgi:hypothetical protein
VRGRRRRATRRGQAGLRPEVKESWPGVWQNGSVRSHASGRPGLALLLGLVVVVAACGSPVPSPAPPSATSAPSSLASASSSLDSDQAIFTEIEAQVEAIRGLHAATPVPLVLLDSNGMRDWLTSANARQTDHQALADRSRLLVHLGLLPAGSSLEQLELDLLVGQAVGFYNTASKAMYVLSTSGGVGPLVKEAFSHEYTHALQDQRFGLDKLAVDTPDQGDRDLARTALPEGDASLVMYEWAGRYLSMADQIEIANDPANTAAAEALARAPAILRHTLIFPYYDGLAFVRGIYKTGGWAAVDQMYANPPDSTSQIIHPELYAAQVKPVAVALPAVPASLGSGWALTMADTLGELQLRILLQGESPSDAETTASIAATSAWAGDRVGLYEGPSGAWAVVLRTDWRTDAGAVAFRTAIASTLGHLPGPAVACADGQEVALYVASDVAALEAFATCRPPL